MSYAKPIWNEVTSCKYKQNKSWGATDNCLTVVKTGSSSSNSTMLGVVEVSRKFYDRFVVFNLYVDDTLISQNINKRNKTRAGDILLSLKDDFMNSKNQHAHVANKSL